MALRAVLDVSTQPKPYVLTVASCVLQVVEVDAVLVVIPAQETAELDAEVHVVMDATVSVVIAVVGLVPMV